jgi:hypothetical protein
MYLGVMPAYYSWLILIKNQYESIDFLESDTVYLITSNVLQNTHKLLSHHAPYSLMGRINL